MLFNRFELMIGVRYLRAKQKNKFVSFISLVSIIGIALGVMVLITVLSVMNGFQKEIRSKIVGVSSHMQILDISNHLSNWQNLIPILKQNSHIVAVAPYIDGQGLISYDGNVSGIMVRAVEPNLENKVEDIEHKVILGDFNLLTPKSYNIVIGSGLARSLGVGLGDKITLITPDGQLTPAGMLPRYKMFHVCAIFSTHMAEYDSSLVLINLEDAKRLYHYANNITGIRLKVDDVMNTPQIKRELVPYLDDNLMVVDWIDQHRDYFKAVELEKKMMFIILVLIVAVATFNLVSTLVMTVHDKTQDIAILRTIGATKSNIMKIFVILGSLSGLIGTSIGAILGVLLGTYIGRIIHFFEIVLGVKVINADIYMIDYLPSKVDTKDVIFIVLISLLLSIIATIYPSKKALNINPVEALRHE
jgi:lipoprotein-releasing system permease protein